MYGREYPPLRHLPNLPFRVPASDEYYKRHREIKNPAYQALKLARVRSTKTAAKRRHDVKPVEVGGKVMILGNQFATESGRTRKLQLGWRGPFIIIEFDEPTWTYTVSMDSRIYLRQRGVFHCSVVKPYHPNDNERLPGRTDTKPAPILIDNKKE